MAPASALCSSQRPRQPFGLPVGSAASGASFESPVSVPRNDAVHVQYLFSTVTDTVPSWPYFVGSYAFPAWLQSPPSEMSACHQIATLSSVSFTVAAGSWPFCSR